MAIDVEFIARAALMDTGAAGDIRGADTYLLGSREVA
jgi:hypothetical protein